MNLDYVDEQSQAGGDRMQKLAIVGALVFTLLVGVAIGWQAREGVPVCRAQSEDSVITGCDYRAGAWFVK